MRLSTPLATILASLALAATSAAQTTSTLITETDVGVFGKIGTTTVLRAVLKNTRILPGVPLNLNGVGRGIAAATTVTHASKGPSVEVRSSASVNPRVRGQAGTTATTNPRAVTAGAHSFLFTIQNPGFKSLDITMISTVAGTPRGGVLVDVGADGSPELRQGVDGKTHRKTVAISGTSAKVRITISGSVGPGAGYDLRVIVGPSGKGGCLISSYGTPCPGTTLTATDTPAGGNHVLDMKIAKALPFAPVALVVGGRKLSVRLPGSPCSLLTNELVVLGLTADGLGNASAKAVFSTTIKGTGFVQAIPYDPKKGLIFASNGLQIDCL